MSQFFPRILSFCFLVIFSLNAFSAEKQLIANNWKFKYGDAPSWSQPSLDDKKWDSVKVPSLIKQLHKTPITGWYRVYFDVHANINVQQAILIKYIRHSDETWLNGAKIGGEGTFDKLWQFNVTNPQGLSRVYKVPLGLLKNKNNLLAIKSNIGFGNALGAMFPGGAGILLDGVYIGDAKSLENYQQRSILQTSSIDLIFITLGLVDIFIILFLLKNALTIFPEFKWLLFTSFFMMLASVGHDFYYIYGFNLVNLSLVLVFSLLGMPLSVALYFWAQYRNIKIKYVKIIVGMWAVLSMLIIIPWVSSDIKIVSWYIWMVLATCFFLYAIACGVKGILMGRVGAITQLLAITVYIISIRTQWLPDNFYGHRNVQIGSLFYRYMLLFAYFQMIKSMQLDYHNLSQRVVRIADDLYSNIARELHDGVGQNLASLKLQTQLAKNNTPNNQHLVNIEEELNTSITSLRRLITGLHPVLIDKYSIAEALKQESQHLEKIYGTKITLETGTVELKKEMEHQLFRIFQECCNNAINHGHASRIKVDLRQKEQNIILSITDNGTGFDVMKKQQPDNTGGLGLISLHERVILLNGQLAIKSCKANGTNIHISIPHSWE